MPEDRPLLGRTVVVTRARAQVAELSDLLEAAGAHVVEFPTLRIADPDDWGPFDDAAAGIADYDWVVLTSANGAAAFFQRFEARGFPLAALSGVKVAAIAEATAARCLEHGVRPDYVPDDSRAEGLVAGLLAQGVGDGTRVLVARAAKGRDVLPDGLRAAGAIVDVVAVYQTVRGEGGADALAALAAGTVDAIVFTSGSSIENFLALTQGLDAPAALRDVAVASIGPVTSDAARAHGLTVGAEAADTTMGALVEAICDHFR